MGYRLARLGHFEMRVKILGHITPWGPKYGFPNKSILWVNISRENAVESGPKFTRLFLSNAGRNSDDNLVFLF